jgi:putative RecB family exonuclease
MRNKQLAKITEHHLHISYSQAWTYLNCSLRYYFQYVRGLERQHTSIALIFGSAMHKALERYYADIMDGIPPTDLNLLKTVFTEYLTSEITRSKIPVLYKKDTPDETQAINLGHNMLEATYDNLPLSPGFMVAGVEVPLAAYLVDTNGHPIDMMLTGIVDLVILDTNMQPIVIDFKTAKQSKAQSAADEDIQMSVYHYLMAENGYSDPDKPLECQFHVFRKLKKPKLETVTTFRNQSHRAKLIKLLNSVLAGIEHQVFIPNKGWLCGDCAYSEACKAW